jgi:hypothetical protein
VTLRRLAWSIPTIEELQNHVDVRSCRTMTFVSCKFLTMLNQNVKKAIQFTGRVAQLGERGVRNAEVEGSIPFSSTIQ